MRAWSHIIRPQESLALYTLLNPLWEKQWELTQEVELAVVQKVVGLLLQPQLLTQVWHVQQLSNNI